MVIYSHSRLSTFEQCPFKFKLKYIDQIIPEIETTIEAHLGKAVHAALEWLYTQTQKGEIPSLDQVISIYLKEWNKNDLNQIKIVKNFSPEYYQNKGIKFIINYYTKHKPFTDNTIEVEKRIIIEIGNHKIQGFIDRLTHNKEKNEYEIHDYKTGNFLPPKEKIDTDRQLALYSIGIKEIYGYDRQVSLIWHYLAHNIKLTSKRTNQELENLKEQIIQLITQIESEEEFKSKKSNLCAWCEYKSMCHEFGGKINEHQTKLINPH